MSNTGLVSRKGVSGVAQQLSQLPRTLDIWLVNLPNTLDLAGDCLLNPEHQGTIAESRYRLYQCREVEEF
jgi:hypothetical protein